MSDLTNIDVTCRDLGLHRVAAVELSILRLRPQTAKLSDEIVDHLRTAADSYPEERLEKALLLVAQLRRANCGELAHELLENEVSVQLGPAVGCYEPQTECTLCASEARDTDHRYQGGVCGHHWQCYRDLLDRARTPHYVHIKQVSFLRAQEPVAGDWLDNLELSDPATFDRALTALSRFHWVINQGPKHRDRAAETAETLLDIAAQLLGPRDPIASYEAPYPNDDLNVRFLVTRAEQLYNLLSPLDAEERSYRLRNLLSHLRFRRGSL